MIIDTIEYKTTTGRISVRVQFQCDNCGKTYFKIPAAAKRSKTHSCSPACRHVMSRKGGKINVFKEITSIQKHGTSWPSKSDLVKDRTKQTNLEKYGAEWAATTQEVKDKIVNTSIEHYGVSNVAKSSIIKERIRETTLQKLRRRMAVFD